MWLSESSGRQASTSLLPALSHILIDWTHNWSVLLDFCLPEVWGFEQLFLVSASYLDSGPGHLLPQERKPALELVSIAPISASTSCIASGKAPRAPLCLDS